MYQYFNNAYPAWYIEGFAEVVSTAVLSPERIVIGRANPARTRDLLSTTWLPMERVLTTSTSQFRDGREAAMFYAQSWLFAHYLLLTPGANAQFATYVRELRSGRPALEAFQQGFGVTPSEMQATLRRIFARQSQRHRADAAHPRRRATNDRDATPRQFATSDDARDTFGERQHHPGRGQSAAACARSPIRRCCAV